MKSLYCSLITLIFAILFISFSWPVQAQSHHKFLQCLFSLHSNDSFPISYVIYLQTNNSYSSILESSIQNLRFSINGTAKPFVIVTPLHASHIQATIRCSKRHGLQIRTRSGGHDMEGLSYVADASFVVIDLVNLKSVDVDVKSRTAWVESGATVGELQYRIAEKSGTLDFPTCTCHTVGKYGLAADNIVDARLINVNGEILDRKSMGEDFFGIVFYWKLKLVHVPSTVTVFTVTKAPQQNATQVVHRWQYIAPKLSDDTFILATISRAEASEGQRSIQFPELGLLKQDCIEMSWIRFVVYFAQFTTEPTEILLDRTASMKSYFKVKSDYVKEPIPEFVFKGMGPMFDEYEGRFAYMNLVPYGARMDEILETETPFPHRAGNIYSIMYATGQDEEITHFEKYINWMRRLHRYMTSFVSKSPREAYVNYRDLDIGVNDKDKTNYEQSSIWELVKVKSLIDPHNFFKHQ
ncbi:hypothetical protein ES332_A11G012300v1 [Gossypium tomentosum]|uniref:FAD-binding PCMH-type domain-containing protein n=1 Tax=Gossypium tomentosum TaxID=34277 RepID=A0A5D2N5E2_GOSTO|nr:hypothetical protein ES332_A11G012300v1 [Gossypium tomentosum]